MRRWPGGLWWGLALLASFLAFAWLHWPALHAQSRPFNLITSPLPINLSAKPGRTVSTDLRVKNGTSRTEKLRVSLFKFSVNDQSEIKIEEPGPSDDFIHWASFSPSVFDAAPNEWNTVRMTINVPSTAGLGYYYGVSFSRANAPTPKPGDSAIEGQVITFVLLDVVVPGAKRELKVAEFSADRKLYEFLPVELTLKIKNSGNIHLVPQGSIFINRGSKTIASLPINPNQGNVLPNSTREFKVEWSDGFPVYRSKIVDNQEKRHLEWDFAKSFNKLRLGKYTAKLVMVYDDGHRDVPTEGRLAIWVIPWRILGLVVLIIGLAGYLGYRYRKLRRQLRQYQSKQS